MQTALLTGDSKTNINLLIELARKLGIKATLLSEEDIEDIGLAKAMKEGRTGKFVNTETFLKRLKKK